MTSISTVQATDLNTLRITMSGAVDPATCAVPHNWTVTPSALAVAVLPTTATVQAGNLIVDLRVEPFLSPGQSYSVAASGALDSALAAISSSASGSAPSVDPSVSVEWAHGPLRAVVRAMAQECQIYAGRPTTISTRDLKDADLILYGESFLGWPSSGAVWVDGQRYTYSSVHGSYRALEGLRAASGVDSDGLTIPLGSEVVCDVSASFPS